MPFTQFVIGAFDKPMWYVQKVMLIFLVNSLFTGCATIKEHNQPTRPLDKSLPNTYRQMNDKLWRKEVLIQFRDGSLQRCPDLNVAIDETTCYDLEGRLLNSWATSDISRILKSRTPSGVLLGGLTGVTIGNLVVYFRHRNLGEGNEWAAIGIPIEIGIATVGGALIGSIACRRITRGRNKILYDLDVIRTN